MKNKGTIITIHGAWGSRLVWQELTPYLKQEGYQVISTSLPGHERPSSTRLIRIGHYVQAVRLLSAGIKNPILLGHSAGGLVAQIVLAEEPQTYRAGILLAPVPPQGVWRTALRMISEHPGSFLRALVHLSPKKLVEGKELARKRLFGEEVPDEHLSRYQRDVEEEPVLAMLQLLQPRFLRIPQTPLLVIGGGKDRLILPREIVTTAQEYGCDCRVVPGMPHMCMYGQYAPVVAHQITSWLDQQ